MYTIIGSDQREYGPVSQDEIKKWILEGRVSKNTLAKSEATGEWKTLGEYPEFADVFAQLAPPPLASSLQSFDEKQWVENLLNRDYELQVGECVSRGFNLYKENFGLLFGAAMIYILIIAGANLLTYIPIIGLLFVLVLICLNPILIGGLFHIFITKTRGGSAEIGDLFYGFKKNPLHLILVGVVTGLLVCAAALPGALIAGLIIFAGIVSKSSIIGIIGIIMGFIIAAIPVIYLSVCWMYSIPIVIDKGLDFWSAMKLSMKKVRQHWFSVLWLAIVMGLIYLAGILLCGIGLFFAAPLAIAAFIYGYETIFGEARRD